MNRREFLQVVPVAGLGAMAVGVSATAPQPAQGPWYELRSKPAPFAEVVRGRNGGVLVRREDGGLHYRQRLYRPLTGERLMVVHVSLGGTRAVVCAAEVPALGFKPPKLNIGEKLFMLGAYA